MHPDLLAEIVSTATYLNPGNNMTPEVLRAIAKHLGPSEIHHSAETGAGGTTLLFSHSSQHHTVFGIEGEERALSRIRASSLLRASSVEFVEGPSQSTLPRHTFASPLDVVLIDGPHAFPFPQLEYFYLYPHLATGGLLILDDIHIRSIHDLFRFLCADDMFTRLEVVGRTAFFRRTAVATFNPYGDGWESQHYNRDLLWRYTARERLLNLLPTPARKLLRRVRSAMLEGPKSITHTITIDTPKSGATVGPQFEVTGRANLPNTTHLWLFLQRDDEPGWWPQQEVLCDSEGKWQQDCVIDDPAHAGHAFTLAAVAVDDLDHRRIRRHIDDAARTQGWSSIPLPKRLKGSQSIFVKLARVLG